MLVLISENRYVEVYTELADKVLAFLGGACQAMEKGREREIEAYLPVHCEAIDKDWMPFKGSRLTETFEENQDAGSL